ncbi:hypothetical protein R1flu_028365 [Riccia fluitans]|uniref:COP9 signalosome complex subunit 6 n=1 Tax=Riccia fluitans TaxID=41844 RepID=A0ABD1XLI9_9MARC
MSSSSGLTFKLHPLVIVNISDHHTRVKAQSGAGSGRPPRVFGCVLGVQTGRTVEIFNSFELKYDSALEGLDRPFLETKQEQYKKVFPKYDVLGWYSTGSDVQDTDMLIHKALMDINESPIYILLNPAINHAQKDLPITLYESELHVIEGAPSLIFVKSSYTIETVEAERISVDHVAHIKPSDGSTAATQLAAHLTGIHSAIKMMNSRVKVLHHHLVSIQKGEVPYEHSLLRQISSLVRRLPAIDSPKFQDDFLMEYNDTLLMTYLATITKCSSTINELVDKFNVAYDKQSRRAGGRSTFI